jgi:hypothetical protein
MKKKITLSESDLVKLVRKVISEQKQHLAKLFGGNVDDIIKSYGDDVAKSLDDVLGKVFSKPGNIVTKGGEQYLKSASGAEIHLNIIKGGLDQVAKGKLQPDDVLKFLPRNLADGTEFRLIFQNAFNKRIASMNAVGRQAALKPLVDIMSDSSPFRKMSMLGSNWMEQNAKNIDFSKITNAKTVDELNNLIAKALKSGDYSMISRGGFEKFGVSNFREFLQKSLNLEKRMTASVSPGNGTWVYNFTWQ